MTRKFLADTHDSPGSIIIDVGFDLPEDKRRLYLCQALRDVEFEPGHIRGAVLWSGYLADTSDDCDGVIPTGDFSKWLDARDRELQDEIKLLKERLCERWKL